MKNEKKEKCKFLKCNLINFFIMIAVIVILVTMLPLVLIISISHPTSPAIFCTSHLKQFGLALKQYAMDFEDQLPVANNLEGINKLKDKGYIHEILQCSVGSKKDFNYYYLGGFKEGDSVNIPLMFDHPGNHSDYANVLFLDGHVEGLRIKDYQQPTQLIQQLHQEHKYSPELLERLLKKCKEP